ncbi:MAG: hypothetical protein ACNA8G_07165 [Gammaproteobacteria bacterium]
MNDSRAHDTRGARLASLVLFLTTALLVTAGTAHADSGFYLDGSIGTALIEPEDVDADFDFDEDDFAAKIFAGYNIDAYGVGVRFSPWSAEIRAEYEYLDIEDTDELSMVSAGVAWTF